nr:resuscitation-promoting factor [Rhodococcus sp. (in: high G+C Gram-positive bacteria)]
APAPEVAPAPAPAPVQEAPALPAEVQPYVDIAVPAVPAEVHQYIDVARGVAVELGYGEQFEQVLDALPAV